jgi:hypothetical protein
MLLHLFKNTVGSKNFTDITKEVRTNRKIVKFLSQTEYLLMIMKTDKQQLNEITYTIY